MPFVQFVKARIEELGLAALDLTLDFDEAEVLEDNLEYLLSTLQMEGVEIKFASDANEKIQEECRPGELNIYDLKSSILFKSCLM